MTPWRPLPVEGRGELLVSEPLGAAGVPARRLLAYRPRGEPPGGAPRPVLLLQDGQNLFDDATSFAGSWRAAETVDAFAETGVAPLVVGVPNSGARRMDEYSPFVDPQYGGGSAAKYLRYLATEVAPLVRRSFDVAAGPQGWGVGGSSLGGHFALWARFTAPELFGHALAMSPTTAFAGEALRDWLVRRRKLAADRGRIYLDCGAEEGRRPGRRRRRLLPQRATAYVRRVRRLRRALEKLGYGRGEDLTYLEERGGEHHEAAWGRRLAGALEALYGART